MQVAILKYDDGRSEKITAVDFSKKNDEDIKEQRRQLYCPDCGVQVAYRKPSTDGKVACFKQYSEQVKHSKGCSHEVKKVISNDKRLIKVIEHTSKILKTSDEPVLLQLSGLEDALKSVTIDENLEDETKDQKEPKAKVVRQKSYDRDPANVIQSTIKLNALLHYLIYSEEEAHTSPIQVNYGNETVQMTLDKLACKFEDAVDDGNYRLYWGKIKTCVGMPDKKRLYVNTEDNLSLVLDDDVMDKFIRHETHQLVMPRDAFKEAYAIVYGKYYITNEGKRHIDVNNLNLISTKVYKPNKFDEYEFTVEKATEKKTSNGNDYANIMLKLKLHDKIWVNVFWGVNLGWYKDGELFCDFLSSVGRSDAAEKGEIELEELIGASGKVELLKERSEYHEKHYGNPYIFKPAKFS